MANGRSTMTNKLTYLKWRWFVGCPAHARGFIPGQGLPAIFKFGSPTSDYKLLARLKDPRVMSSESFHAYMVVFASKARLSFFVVVESFVFMIKELVMCNLAGSTLYTLHRKLFYTQ